MEQIYSRHIYTSKNKRGTIYVCMYVLELGDMA